MSLRKQTFSGLIWTFTDTFVLKGLAFIASLILARLLGPTEFGLVGMIAVFVALGVSLVDSGLSASIIRTKDADDRDYSTVFYLNLGMSCAVYLLMYFSAPFIADFYSQPVLTDIVRLYCFSFVISAFSAVQTAMLTQKMQFKKIAQYNIPGTIIGVVVGVSMGYMGYGVWSIVWMYLSTQIVQSITLWAFSTWKPTLTFDRERMKYHYGFGYKLMLSGILTTSFQNLSKIVIGKFFSVQTLGFYERASTINRYPVTVLTSIITRVTYPLLSKIQDEKERIANVYRKLIQFTFYITAPMMIGASAIAKPLFLLILGEQWLPAVPFFQILCLGSMLLPIHAFNLNILKVYGRSDLFLRLEVIKKIVTIISIVIGYQFGIYGLVWNGVITSLIALIINTHYSAPLIDYSTKRQLLDLLPTLAKSGLMYLVMWGMVILLSPYSIYYQIIVPSILGAAFYFGLSYILKPVPFVFLVQLIKNKKF